MRVGVNLKICSSFIGMRFRRGTHCGLFLILILSIFSSGLLSCSGYEVKDNGKRPSLVLAEGGESSRSLVLRSNTQCTEESKCSPAVALLGSTQGENAFFCTAYLVSPQIMVTSSQCIPQDLRSAGASCENRIWAFFPKIGSLDESQAPCAKIISTSSNTESKFAGPHYTYLSLQVPVNRPALPIEAYSPGFEEKFSIQKMEITPYHDHFRGVLIEETCKNYFGNFLNPLDEYRPSPLLSLADCTISKGNIGAPLINLRGKAFGILQAKVDENDVSAKLTGTSMIDSTLAPLGIAANLGCTSPPAELGFQVFEGCITRNEKDQPPTEWINSRLRVALEKNLQHWDSSLSWLRWESQSLTKEQAEKLSSSPSDPHLRLYFVPYPKCFAPTDQWIKHYKNLLGHPNKTYEETLDWKSWRFDFGPNQYLQADYREVKSELETKKIRVQFSPAKAQSLQKSVFKVSIRLPQGDDLVLMEKELSVCP